MWMLERSTGMKIADIATGMLEGTHPDWSPDNSQLVFATGDGDAPGNASIAVAPYNANTRDRVRARPGRSRRPDGTALPGQGTGAAPRPVELLRANRVVSNEVGTRTASRREYGVVRSDGTQQIWIAAVDLSTAATGRDPSYPAFRLPMQGLDENNHRADAAARDATQCIAIGDICQPGGECCGGGLCDTIDDGDTYRCVPNI